MVAGRRIAATKEMRSGNILSSFLKVDPPGFTDRFQSTSVAMRGSGNPE